MNFELKNIADAGDMKRERLILKATSDADVGRFAIFVSSKTGDGQISGGRILDAYWFPDKQIKAGDFVVLYSKDGAKSEKEVKGITSHFFYWGLTTTRWSDGEAAVLVELNTWKTMFATEANLKAG